MTWYSRIAPTRQAPTARPGHRTRSPNLVVVMAATSGLEPGLRSRRRATLPARATSDCRTVEKLASLPPRQDDQVDSARQFRFAQAERFSNQSLEVIAGMGRADLLARQRDPHPGVVAAILDAVDHQHVVGVERAVEGRRKSWGPSVARAGGRSPSGSW